MVPAKELLGDQDVRRWYENMARGSKLTASVRLRRLNLFCKRTGKTPAELVRIGKKNIMNLENILLDHVSWLESQNYAPGYIDGILKAIRSWFAFNYVQLKRRIKITNADIPVRIQDERVPTKEELASILDVSGPRGRTSISLMALAGLRPQVLGNHDATDGLCLSDIEGLAIKDNQVSLSKGLINASNFVSASLSPTAHSSVPSVRMKNRVSLRSIISNGLTLILFSIAEAIFLKRVF